ncbi:Mov34/MPN/PAD-1 family protein [Sphingomonas abietis]|uniref:Mov34/MPN/PAD-1 family protein n=1 Tax=Sphingomonas abietis TaxID=3012344 RepID=A0ABY7NNV0_9SPHN|nr:Mov34/MPN/PAD-1 family protein [Sphingomonas abietis]WBO22500.1 Mov34/MPN/PAD-1 family protein [Sphingomonas abietis]
MAGEDATMRSRLARSVVRYLTEAADHPYAKLIDARRDDALDIIDVEVEPELAQHRKVAIAGHEPVRIIFAGEDDAAPHFRSLREDFPIGEVHTNLNRGADGLGLCIWEENWHDLSRTLTGQMLIERIRSWFSLMASGRLHGEDQPLEPLISAVSHTIVIPAGVVAGPWHVHHLIKDRGVYTLIMSETASTEAVESSFAIFHRELPPQVHRGLADRPYSLGDLNDLLNSLGVDLVAELTEWLTAPEQTSKATERQLLLMLAIPMQRTAEGPVEGVEVWVYTVGDTLAALGEKLGATFTQMVGASRLTAKVLLQSGSKPDLSEIPLPGWRVVQRLNRRTARIYAATLRTEDAKLVAIGAGAIGSNVVSNTVRAGIGQWTVIDDDSVLPHNTVRQTQIDLSVGFPKAKVLCRDANRILAEDSVSAIVADVLDPGDQADGISAAYAEADVVVDFSASPAVVGHLSDQTIRRAASFFFSPDGSDLVLLAEDGDRRHRLDELEAQYFFNVASDPFLDGHLAAARADRIRYANACQDLSRPLPPWRVQMLSGLAGGQLIDLVDLPDPAMRVWRLDPSSGGLLPVILPVDTVHRFGDGPIRATVTQSVVDAMRDHREKAAPNETGGVLVGTFDFVRGVVHVLGVIPAPSDSRQAPTYFIRGAKDLEPLVQVLGTATAGRLQYVGEWHSHPDGAAARPSADDEKVFEHLRSHLDPVGAPFVMMICGATDTWLRAGWDERGRLEGVIPHDAN